MKRTTRPGFSLVELVVTLGVIVFLAGLTATAVTTFAERAEVRATTTTVTLLDMAVQEWEIATDRKLSWGETEDHYDIWSDRAHTLIITELLDTIRRAGPSRSILGKIDPDLVHTYEADEVPLWIKHDYDAPKQFERFANGKSITVLDAWGRPIYATHPGALRDNAPDHDGTERTPNEMLYGVSDARRVCFVSAGPDGFFGLYREFYQVPFEERDRAIERAKSDNIYSYAPSWPPR